MSTGFTHKVADGQSFKDFVLGCARATGYLTYLRDSPDVPLPDRIPVRDSALGKLNDAESEFHRLAVMNVEQQVEYGERIIADASDLLLGCVLSVAHENYMTVKMKERVLAWTPPTSGHDSLKTFMLAQLDSTMTKISTRMLQGFGDAIDKTPLSIYNAELKTKSEALAEARQEYEKAVRRAEEGTVWLKQLRESVEKSE